MARKKSKPTKQAGKNSSAPAAPQHAGERVQGYFRKTFKENPKLLTERSNEKILGLWLDDHPGVAVVPDNVKNGLANLKSILRRKLGKRGRRRREELATQATAGSTVNESAPGIAVAEPDVLELLEIQIDDVLSYAKAQDRNGLAEVIRHLRLARNLVVWQGGKP